ncbi:MAG: hypothetical protein D6776_06510, partial [Planctomycetota bacterium]
MDAQVVPRRRRRVHARDGDGARSEPVTVSLVIQFPCPGRDGAGGRSRAHGRGGEGADSQRTRGVPRLPLPQRLPPRAAAAAQRGARPSSRPPPRRRAAGRTRTPRTGDAAARTGAARGHGRRRPGARARVRLHARGARVGSARTARAAARGHSRQGRAAHPQPPRGAHPARGELPAAPGGAAPSARPLPAATARARGHRVRGAAARHAPRGRRGAGGVVGRGGVRRGPGELRGELRAAGKDRARRLLVRARRHGPVLQRTRRRSQRRLLLPARRQRQAGDRADREHPARFAAATPLQGLQHRPAQDPPPVREDRAVSQQRVPQPRQAHALGGAQAPRARAADRAHPLRAAARQVHREARGASGPLSPHQVPAPQPLGQGARGAAEPPQALRAARTDRGDPRGLRQGGVPRVRQARLPHRGGLPARTRVHRTDLPRRRGGLLPHRARRAERRRTRAVDRRPQPARLHRVRPAAARAQPAAPAAPARTGARALRGRGARQHRPARGDRPGARLHGVDPRPRRRRADARRPRAPRRRRARAPRTARPLSRPDATGRIPAHPRRQAARGTEEPPVSDVIRSQIDPRSERFADNAAHHRQLAAELRERLAAVRTGGGERAQKRHTARGKLLVRERIERLIDPGSAFLELSPLAAWDMYDGRVASAGIVTGVGLVSGRRCMLIANDATVKGGSYHPMTVKKHLRAQQVAAENELPCIYLVDSGGAFLPLQAEVFPDREHFGRIFFNQARLSARGIAQIAVVLGSCTAGGAYVPAMSDETIIVAGQGTIFLGGPPLVRAATGEVVSAEELGGADVHCRRSGVTDHYAHDELEALAMCREIVADLGSARRAEIARREPLPPAYDPQELYGVLPRDPRQGYDVR